MVCPHMVLHRRYNDRAVSDMTPRRRTVTTDDKTATGCGSVSVVVPCYNGADTLEPVLDALLSAEPPPLEIIVVDDRSTDGSADIADRDGVTLERLECHQGVAAARNRGASVASGSILCFVDADIVVPGDLIRRIETAFVEHPDCAVVSAAIDPDYPRYDFFSQYLNLRLNHGFRHLGKDVTTLCTSCAAIRRDTFDLVSGFDGSATLAVNDEAVLGWRLAERGLRSCFPEAFSVVHLKRMNLADWIRKFWNEGRQWILIADRHRKESRVTVRRSLNFRRPANVGLFVLCSTAIPGMSFLGGPVWPLVLGWAGGMVLLNATYLRYMARMRNLFWLPGVLAMLGLETALHTAGMLTGIVVRPWS